MLGDKLMACVRLGIGQDPPLFKNRILKNPKTLKKIEAIGLRNCGGSCGTRARPIKQHPANL